VSSRPDDCIIVYRCGHPHFWGAGEPYRITLEEATAYILAGAEKVGSHQLCSACYDLQAQEIYQQAGKWR